MYRQEVRLNNNKTDSVEIFFYFIVLFRIQLELYHKIVNL
jgi:hypothetical protein